MRSDVYPNQKMLDIHSRATFFSVNLGLRVGAGGLAAFFGKRISEHWGQSISLIYLSLTWTALALCLWAFIVPESLSEETRRANARRIRPDSVPDHLSSGRISTTVRQVMSGVLSLIRPLSILKPCLRDPRDSSKGKDWNIVFLSLIAVFVQGSIVSAFIRITSCAVH